MSNMSYCRHENTSRDLDDVWELWGDYVPGTNEHEDRARKRIVKLVAAMHEQFAFDGTYADLGIEVDD